MAMSVATTVVISGCAAGALGAIAAARRGKDGGTVAATGGLMATVAALGFFVSFAFSRPEQRVVRWGVLCLFVAGLAAVAVGALIDHFEKLRKRWAAREGGFGLREVAKGLSSFPWVVGVTVLNSLTHDRPSIYRSFLIDLPYLVGLLLLYGALFAADLRLVRRWSREQMGG